MSSDIRHRYGLLPLRTRHFVHTRFPQTVETLSEALRRTLQERLHGTFHHPDHSAYSCRDSRTGNAVRSVLRKAETRFQRKPLIYFNISILSFISYVSGKCPAGCPSKIIPLWRTACINARRSVRKDVHTENNLKWLFSTETCYYLPKLTGSAYRACRAGNCPLPLRSNLKR